MRGAEAVTLEEGRDEGTLVRLTAAALRSPTRTATSAGRDSGGGRFGGMIGDAPSMRRAFALLERAARSNATVLLEGETGTGKGKAAEALHAESARRDGPMLTIDCGAIAPSLLESELFGHERGAFTGAAATRIGLFEEAAGGTLFLDEIGEMPIDLQPKLLRVLENHEVRRVGSNHPRPVDVRIVAATNRDLRALVDVGRFRADLYFRVAVLKISLPPLRARREDLPALVDDLLTHFGVGPVEASALRTAEFRAVLDRAPWSGNVRELRNFVERCLVFQDAHPLRDDAGREEMPALDAGTSLVAARRCAIDAFERRYLEELLRVHGRKMTRAAKAAGIGRVYLYKLLKRHGLT